MNLIEAIIAKIEPGEIPAHGGDPGAEDYPFITVDVGGARAVSETNTPAGEDEVIVQVTVSALSPSEAAEIGVPIEQRLLPASGPILWDEGRQGREITRWRSDTRERYQTEAAPGGRTIYYYEVDIVMLIQR